MRLLPYNKLLMIVILSLLLFNSLILAVEVKEEDKNNDRKTDLWIYYDISDRQSNVIRKIETLPQQE